MYENFRKLNGRHPWRDVSPNGYVDYPVRYKSGGRVLYFNYPLARELGLIDEAHPNRMTAPLEKKLLETFSLQIINEYDQKSKKGVFYKPLTGRLYMATRYLQSQHKNKRGKTSGDGRSIWNGFIKTRKMTFDVSSRGTGATILSPGVAALGGRALPTGSQSHSYASGLADMDEMLGSAIMSEIFYREGIPTERCLVVIDYPDKTAIGVRTAPNLIRPAHIFRYLKLEAWKDLKRSYDYFLKRQEENGVWSLPKAGRARYQKSLEYLTKTYARLGAVLEEEYIFNWLAWDGDNILASGALLDYGSIRRFAAKHNKYRYDDVDRFSTCLSEQRYWAQKQIQIFAQVVDFIVTGKKKSLGRFARHKEMAAFDRCFALEREKRMLYRMGFTAAQIDALMIRHSRKVRAFRRVLNYFEEQKTVRGPKKVPDGIDHPPVFLIRHILRELPVFLLKNKRNSADWPFMPPEEFCRLMAASYVNRKDLTLNKSRAHKSRAFQKLYMALIRAAGKNDGLMLQNVAKRSNVINYAYRSTGDGLICLVDCAIATRDRIDRQKLQETIDRFIESQVLVPERWNPIKPQELKRPDEKSRLLRRMQKTVEEYSEAI